MAKSYENLRADIKEWQMSSTASGAAFVEPIMSLRTGKTDFMKKPSLRQLKKKPVTAKSIAKAKMTSYSQGGIT